MRQELKNLRLAVDREETRPLKSPKADQGPGLGERVPGGGGELGTDGKYLNTHFPPEKRREEKWKEEEGKRSDPRPVGSRFCRTSLTLRVERGQVANPGSVVT
jgi:hypothetical protein